MISSPTVSLCCRWIRGNPPDFSADPLSLLLGWAGPRGRPEPPSPANRPAPAEAPSRGRAGRPGPWGRSPCGTRRRRTGAPPRRSRFVRKDGHCNVEFVNPGERSQRYLGDLFTTCVDARWRWLALLFSLAFVLSWPAGWRPPCTATWAPRPPRFTQVTGPLGAFLLSLETQTSTGYGSRGVTEACPAAVLAVGLQCVAGCPLDASLLGAAAAKVARPKKRNRTLLFSRCLIWRVANLRRSQLVGAHVRARLLQTRVTPEGEFLPLDQRDVDVGFDSGTDRLFLVSPLTVVHQIDDTSPFYGLGLAQLARADFELVAILEGMVEATAMTTQRRTSYLPGELRWGHCFAPVLARSCRGRYRVDFHHFHRTSPVPGTPRCSAWELGQESPGPGPAGAPHASFCYVNELALREQQLEEEEEDGATGGHGATET
ncbi:LOW QUALITY PROTEIN: ATP-sensitive inward rectifier potassium channel 14-like [Chelonia mydas]|uniref:LOW QUALITY PROTEIN: ATP-sensitive inward rectifier potassium channel 14-like n=1 Tax=Chelonia mydas TaxID=8469 RepID=UPI001CAA05A4|nr:LOW QUALITY PROTEIN: ATP-sensitive inward rectifier potassium channel 14-like [Chelonia mydas]